MNNEIECLKDEIRTMKKQYMENNTEKTMLNTKSSNLKIERRHIQKKYEIEKDIYNEAYFNYQKVSLRQFLGNWSDF